MKESGKTFRDEWEIRCRQEMGNCAFGGETREMGRRGGEAQRKEGGTE